MCNPTVHRQWRRKVKSEYDAFRRQEKRTSVQKGEAWMAVDIGQEYSGRPELKVGGRYPCRRSKFRGERPINNRGPLSAPYIWDVPPVIVVQQPDSGEGTPGYNWRRADAILAPPLYDNQPGLPQRWLFLPASPPRPPVPFPSVHSSVLPTLGCPRSCRGLTAQYLRVQDSSQLLGQRPLTLRPSARTFFVLHRSPSHVLRLSFCVLSVDPPYRCGESSLLANIQVPR